MRTKLGIGIGALLVAGLTAGGVAVAWAGPGPAPAPARPAVSDQGRIGTAPSPGGGAHDPADHDADDDRVTGIDDDRFVTGLDDRRGRGADDDRFVTGL